MEYFLAVYPHRYGETKINIAESRFNSLRTARAILKSAFDIEQLYEAVIASYIEQEQTMFNVAVPLTVKRGFSIGHASEIILLLNRRINGLLTSVSSYRDGVSKSSLMQLFDRDKDIATIKPKELFKNQYDASFEYRFMEALRNHSQHYGASVHEISHGGGWEGEESLVWSLDYFSSKKELAKNEKFKAAVLEQMSDKVNLVRATRRYIESISSIHTEIRNVSSGKIKSARSEIEAAINDCIQNIPNEHYAWAAFSFDGNEVVDSVTLLLDWDDIRKKLTSENEQLSNLDRTIKAGASERS